MDATFLQARIDATEAQIVAYEAAVDAIVAGRAQSYMIDTGQTRQTVTKLDLPALTRSLDVLYNRVATLEARRDGTNVVTMQGGW